MVIKKTEKSPKTDAKKIGPIEDRKGEDRDRPKTGNCRTGTSLVNSYRDLVSLYEKKITSDNDFDLNMENNIQDILVWVYNW